ncbi:MAG: membrane protein [Candidatus Bathyarchaeota archaeon]|nr:membrane protein [Candidatus Bathyarchaeota archaeon]
MLNADLGMNTWAVLDCGIIKHVDLTLGQTTQLTGFIALGAGWLMGFPPGYATLISIFFMGNAIDQMIKLGFMPQPAGLPGKLFLIVFSAACFGAGTLLYVKPELGAGPRDSLMMGLIQRLSSPVAYIRIGLELVVIIIGYLLGGPVGVGTLLSSVLVGYAVDIAFRVGGYKREAQHMGLGELVRWLRSSTM